MKKLIVYTLLFQLLVFMGCKKEMMSYEGREGVYFAVRHGQGTLTNLFPYQPFSSVDFVTIDKDFVDFPLKVTITGPVKDYDRTFGLMVNPDSTTAVEGKHYEKVQSEWKVPAGAVSVDIFVRVKRTPDIAVTPVNLGLTLVATKDFELSFPEFDAIPSYNAGIVVPKFNAGLHTLKVNDIMVQPAVWPGSIQAGNRESGVFGQFTRRKMQFLIDNLGLKYTDFASPATMPQARYLLVGSDATIILKKRFDEKKPVLEEDGRLMFIGSVPWTSIIGVPYVP